MCRLKLAKARSYTRGNITATKEKPVVDIEDAETANALLASGYFSLLGVTVTDALNTEKDSGADAESAEGETSVIVEADSGGTLKGFLAREELSKWEDGVLRKLAADMGVEGAESLDRDALLDAVCAEEVEAEPEPDYDALSKMNKADLTIYAKEREIDIGKCKTKSDILTAISMAYGGSPTIIDLQRDNQGGDNE